MIPTPSGVRVWLAAGHADMRKGFDGLALLVQERLKHNPHCGYLFVFRGRRGGLIKVLWHDGQGMCLLPSTQQVGKGFDTETRSACRVGSNRTVISWLHPWLHTPDVPERRDN